MKARLTDIHKLLILEPKVFNDERGFFFESYNEKTLSALGIDDKFVQDNHSQSSRGVLRGIHYQVSQPQAKLVRAIAGEVFDVAVDLRKSSSTFGRWFGVKLSAENKLQLYIPVGFGHGFVTLSDRAEMLYKASDFYCPEGERCIRWDDPDLAISWPDAGDLIISAKDLAGRPFRSADLL